MTLTPEATNMLIEKLSRLSARTGFLEGVIQGTAMQLSDMLSETDLASVYDSARDIRTKLEQALKERS